MFSFSFCKDGDKVSLIFVFSRYLVNLYLKNRKKKKERKKERKEKRKEEKNQVLTLRKMSLISKCYLFSTYCLKLSHKFISIKDAVLFQIVFSRSISPSYISDELYVRGLVKQLPEITNISVIVYLFSQLILLVSVTLNKIPYYVTL